MSETTDETTTLPPVAQAAVSVLLLARNDEAHAESVLESWGKQLDQLQRDYEIIVVDDGSSDRTAEIVGQVAQTQSRLKLLSHAQPQGVGAALKTGLAAARYPLLFYTTCDRRYQAVDFHLLLADIDKVHLVSGFRRWQPVPRPLRALGRIWRITVRLLFSVESEPLQGWLGWRQHAYSWFTRAMFGLRLRDERCLFRLFRRPLFERIPIQSQGDFVHDEVLAKANFLGALMSDVPIQFRPPGDSAATARDLSQGWLQDFLRVFSHPDFGPTHLGPDSQWATLAVGQ
jgi:glycosyltransferase involved in cell wall biosynthesis